MVQTVSNQIAALVLRTLNAEIHGIVPNQKKMDQEQKYVPYHAQHARQAVITSPVTVLTAHSQSVIQLAASLS